MKTLAEFRAVYDLPLPELVLRAAEVHREHRDYSDVQRCALLSIKTGLPEDCGYCSQSAHYDTPSSARSHDGGGVREGGAGEGAGATRFCMGARGARRTARIRSRAGDGARRTLGMEACVTLGMLSDEQARRLADAGLTAYNHNLDTSRRYYPEIITTRNYDDRLDTLRAVSRAGISVCCGGILGMGETEDDRLMMLVELANLETPPESVPINCLMPATGTPLAMAPTVDSVELVRLIAVARIAFPRARVRLSAGRDRMSRELQILCFLAGADSVFFGEKLLTAPNPDESADAALFRAMGLPVPSAELS